MESTDNSVEERIKLCQDIVSMLRTDSQRENSVVSQLKSLSIAADELAELTRCSEDECKTCIEGLLRLKTDMGSATERQLEHATKLENELRVLEESSLASSKARDERIGSLEESKRRLKTIKDEEARLKAEAKKLSDAVSHDLPLLSQLAKLYLSATKVKFVFDGSTSSAIRGFVSNPGSVLPFTFDVGDAEQSSIMRQLWDMMEESW